MTNTCPACGTEPASETARHCHECGAPLDRSTTGGAGAAPPPPPQREPSFRPMQHPSGLSSETRNWAMFAHLGALLSGFLTGGLLTFLGPMVVWLAKREEHPFIEEHGREALNFAISICIYAAVSYVLMLVFIGFLLFVGVAVAGLVFMIIAAVRAANGEPYRYPLTIRFVS